MINGLVENFLEFLRFLSQAVPLPLFAFLGSFIEEIVAPLPSPFVMMLAGSIIGLSTLKLSIINMVFISAIGALGKTLAALIVYYVSDKSEDLVVGKFGKFFGITKGSVEALGKYLDKKRSEFPILFLLRVIPIFPSTPISVVAGIIKVNIRSYISSTFWGTTIRNMFYMILGYSSFEALESIIERMDKYEYLGYAILALAVLGVFVYLRVKNKKEAFFQKFIDDSKNKDAKF